MSKPKIIFYAALILLFILPLIILPGQVDGEQIDDQLGQIKNEKSQTSKKIEEAKKKEAEYLEQVSEVEDRLLETLSQLQELNESLSASKAELDKISVDLVLLEVDLQKIEKELEEKTEVLNTRIASIYKTGPHGFFEVILRAEGFIDFVSKYKLMNLIADRDAQVIREIQEKKLAITQVKSDIIALRDKQRKDREKIEALIAEAEGKKSEAEEIFNEKKELLTQATANKEALIAIENQLERKEKEIGRTLVSYDYGTAPTGKLAWPTNGKLSSGFGPRTSRSGRSRLHAGIDLYAPTGTPIIASDNGQVIKTEYHGGYGYCILIYHGGGIATFYAHLSGFAVSSGQNVQRGQVIGYVGTTGYTTGPHLHFEVRVNGSPQNPFNYL
jgi:murein DD-endopeptidase MepM/ murein hydrolase activator NlpD